MSGPSLVRGTRCSGIKVAKTSVRFQPMDEARHHRFTSELADRGDAVLDQGRHGYSRGKLREGDGASRKQRAYRLPQSDEVIYSRDARRSLHPALYFRATCARLGCGAGSSGRRQPGASRFWSGSWFCQLPCEGGASLIVSDARSFDVSCVRQVLQKGTW